MIIPAFKEFGIRGRIKMHSNAPGQLFGYTLQFPRAFYHLLKAGPGDSVCVEVLGDVVTKTSDDKVIAEEDKSSTIGNPLTDRSTDLWKTFFNWMKAINNKKVDIEKTQFVLYCNHSGRDGIVNKFSLAQNQQEAQIAIDYAKKILKNISHDHDIWEFYNFVINQNESLLLQIIEKFELEIGNGTGFDEVHYELKRKLFPANQLEFLSNNISGWLLKKIIEKIAMKELAIISWEEFNQQFSVLFDRARRLELIDFTLQNPLKEHDIKRQIKIWPYYLRQLEAIGVSDDEMIEAVSEFLRAEINRGKWIEDGIMDDAVAIDFNSRLEAFWKNQKKRIEITEKNLSEKERGKLLLADCKSRQENIRDSSPPYPTIAGTYHALANEPIIGWHPNWEKLVLKKKDE